MLSVGDRVPDFTLRGLDGIFHSLHELNGGKTAVLAVFKISCPTCQLTLPYLERLAGNERMPVILISQDDEEGTREFHDAFGISLTTVLDTLDAGYPVSNSLGVRQVPSLFVVEPDGLISEAETGFCRQQIESLGQRAGIRVFQEQDRVPDWKPG